MPFDSESIGAKVLRHIIGNPFRPATAPPSGAASVLDLAAAVYDGKPVSFALHDALLDASHADLAEHFRDADEWHPKGCWVLDLILDKE